jgi:hypothetical protein
MTNGQTQPLIVGVYSERWNLVIGYYLEAACGGQGIW